MHNKTYKIYGNAPFGYYQIGLIINRQWYGMCQVFNMRNKLEIIDQNKLGAVHGPKIYFRYENI